MHTIQPPYSCRGSKRKVAPMLWQHFGDVKTYIEPFAGSLATLLARPATRQPFAKEFVGDADGLLVNFWRSIRHDPAAVARHFVCPVSDLELQATNRYLISQRQTVSKKLCDKRWYDAELAGWWCWGQHLVANGDWCGHRSKLTSTIPWERTIATIRQLTERQLVVYFTELAERMKNVAVFHGDWIRTLKYGLRRYTGKVGILLDPPYSGSTGRRNRAYAVDSLTVAEKVASWCRANGDNRDFRIALCGYNGEHSLPDWRCHAWKSKSGGSSAHRERIWLSPGCL